MQISQNKVDQNCNMHEKDFIFFLLRVVRPELNPPQNGGFRWRLGQPTYLLQSTHWEEEIYDLRFSKRIENENETRP